MNDGKRMIYLFNLWSKVLKMKKAGSVSISAIMVLTLMTISCAALQERIVDYIESENTDIKSENLLRRAEGAAIIAEEKIVEATQRLYDSSVDRRDFKRKIESYSYRKQYVAEIEDIADVNIENVKIDVYRDDIAQDGLGVYKFWVYITVKEGEFKREIDLCVTLKNLFKEKPIKDENNKPNNQENPNIPENPGGNIEAPGENIENPDLNNPDLNNPDSENDTNQEIDPEEDIPERYNARDALIFRVKKE